MTELPVVDLDTLDPGRRVWVEDLVTSGSVLLRAEGRPLGTLTFSSAVLVGSILPGPVTDQLDGPGEPREGTKVLATTMCLSSRARDLLRQSFGPGWVVLDLHDAPDTADVVLTSAHSPQLTHRWTLLFPKAQIIVTEIYDPELGLDIAGPVGRLLDAGAHAYLPPRPLEQVAENVRAYLESRALGALGSSPPTIHQLNS